MNRHRDAHAHGHARVTLGEFAARRLPRAQEPEGSALGSESRCTDRVVTQTEGKGPYGFHGSRLVLKTRENLVVDVKCLVYFGSLWCDLQ